MSISSTVNRWRSVRAGEGGGPADEKALDELTGYIPTESITLFVATVGVAAALAELAPFITLWKIYGFWALATPGIVWLVAYGKHKKSGSAEKMAFPTWPMLAATVAFLVWAMAVPGMIGNQTGQLLAAFGAVVISKVLSLFAPVFGG